jgi:hypothetical protein
MAKGSLKQNNGHIDSRRQYAQPNCILESMDEDVERRL